MNGRLAAMALMGMAMASVEAPAARPQAFDPPKPPRDPDSGLLRAPATLRTATGRALAMTPVDTGGHRQRRSKGAAKKARAKLYRRKQ